VVKFADAVAFLEGLDLDVGVLADAEVDVLADAEVDVSMAATPFASDE
jgi:hypothetical protein